jgi:hypothetical protein
MTKILEEAIAEVETLPQASQQKIGDELLAHVKKMHILRAELQKGVRSLEQGEGRELDVGDVIKRARAKYGRR